MAITRVGESPLQRDVRPSLRAILRRPSRVEVKFLRRVSSTAQSAAEAMDEEGDGEDDGAKVLRAEGGATIQYGEALLTQKTSRQHAVTPRFGGRFEKDVGRLYDRERVGLGCD